ncbi:DUF418 domain-containing protein [Myxococcus dinghuensis]|uniref:DUF418 domain-containing protein n=1 Tax=Myxococcus dinghuensis TaxID=2906761 RepID=UPI002B1FFDBE|nr:DUF418 domain-containing protein [Myxococcus dinghuensis]
MDVSERVTLVDVLRGFALCGVFVSNSVSWFSGRVMMPRDQSQALSASAFETAVTHLYNFFVNQKFVTLFAFLFGLGFSIQLARAQARGASVVPVYSRRLLVLLGIGLTHQYAIWCGDVLNAYALVGFVLLLFRARSDRTLFYWAVTMLVVVPLVYAVVDRFVPIWLHGAELAKDAAKATRALETASRARLLEALSGESFWGSLVGTARFNVEGMLRPQRLLWMGLILGRFLLGLLAGRHLLLQDLERHRAFHGKLLRWGLLVGILGNGFFVVTSRLRAEGVVDVSGADWMVLSSTLQELGYLGLAAAYLAGFALASREPWSQRVFGWFSPVGRMALTNYLTQSVVSVWLYNGWGLGFIAKVPPSWSVGVALGIFVVQTFISRWWLARFRFGPAEWLWRSLTYGKAQPMRLGAGGGAVGAAVS